MPLRRTSGTFCAQQVPCSGASDVQIRCRLAILAAGKCSPAIFIIPSAHPLAIADMCDDTAGPLIRTCRCPKERAHP